MPRPLALAACAQGCTGHPFSPKQRLWTVPGACWHRFYNLSNQIDGIGCTCPVKEACRMLPRPSEKARGERMGAPFPKKAADGGDRP